LICLPQQPEAVILKNQNSETQDLRFSFLANEGVEPRLLALEVISTFSPCAQYTVVE